MDKIRAMPEIFGDAGAEVASLDEKTDKITADMGRYLVLEAIYVDKIYATARVTRDMMAVLNIDVSAGADICKKISRDDVQSVIDEVKSFISDIDKGTYDMFSSSPLMEKFREMCENIPYVGAHAHFDTATDRSDESEPS